MDWALDWDLILFVTRPEDFTRVNNAEIELALRCVYTDVLVFIF